METVGRNVSSNKVQTSFIGAGSTTGKHLVWELGIFGRVGKTVGALGMQGSMCHPPLPRHQQHNHLWVLQAVPVAAAWSDEK